MNPKYDASFALFSILMAVVLALLVSFLISLAAAKKLSMPRTAFGIRAMMMAFVLTYICVAPLIVLPLYYPVYYLFITLPKAGRISSWGPVNYVAGVAPFAAVAFGVYFYNGIQMGAHKKALIKGAIFSLFVLLGPMMCLYTKVEFLTAIYGKELKQVKISNFDDFAKEDIIFMKVFEYDDTKAKTFAVYCIQPGEEGPPCDASYYYYERESIVDKWQFATYNSLWGGNRDDDISWPPY